MVCTQERNAKVLRAMCDGTVLLTREKCNLDWDSPEIQAEYGHRMGLPIHKLHFHVLPKIGRKFRLVEMV